MAFFSSDNSTRFAHGIRRDARFIHKAWMGPAGSIRNRAHQQGIEWMKWNVGLGKLPAGIGTVGKVIGRGLGPVFTLWDAYQGYKEGGITGAAMNVGKNFAYTYAMGYAASLAGSVGATALGVATVGLGLGAAGVVGYAGMTGQSVANVLSPLARPWVHDYAKRFRNLEMGAPVADPFGTVATMRQRSIMAIQNSRINGRNAIGSEALLMYQPYFR